MKSNGFFILAALLVLGYLHLLTMYAHRIDSRVFSQLEGGEPGALPQFAQIPVPSTHLISKSRLNYMESLHQMKQANQTVAPIVQPMEGNPIPKDSGSVSVEEATARSQRVVYIITPTYERMTQRVDLIRLQQTLQLASLQHHAKIYWIVVEDAANCSQHIRTVLQDSGLAFAHQAIPYNPPPKGSKNQGHRGLAQRNLGLDIVQQIGKEGVIYFADDDNAYDDQLITELTYTRHTSIFAVAMSGGSAWERCHVDPKTGLVDAILTTWKPRYRVPVAGKPGKFMNPIRKYGIDMAGFALSTTALETTNARFQSNSTSGMLETDFLSLLVKDVSELEPLAANCTRILVWHVKTVEPDYFNNPEADEATFELIKTLM